MIPYSNQKFKNHPSLFDLITLIYNRKIIQVMAKIFTESYVSQYQDKTPILLIQVPRENSG